MCVVGSKTEGEMQVIQSIPASDSPVSNVRGEIPTGTPPGQAGKSASHAFVREASPRNKLKLVFWETASGCNLECIHCRRIDVAAALAKQDMSTEQAMHFIDSLAECAKPILVFSGGEPLFRKDIFSLAMHAQRRGIITALATNRTLIDDLTSTHIVAAGFQRVAISIDGADAETHDRFRGIPGSFARALNGFLRLRRLGMSM